MSERRRMMHRPYAFQVEYLESSGTQWIDTGIIPTDKTIVQTKFKNLEVTGNVILGYYVGSDTTDWRLFNYGSQAYLDAPSNRRSAGGQLKANTLYELELGNLYVKNLSTGINVSGVESTTEFTGVSTITLNNYNNSRFSKNVWYYVKIYEGRTLLRDFIPVRVGNVGYMYDKVSNKLFGNAGTGNFILGQDV